MSESKFYLLYSCRICGTTEKKEPTEKFYLKDEEIKRALIQKPTYLHHCPTSEIGIMEITGGKVFRTS